MYRHLDARSSHRAGTADSSRRHRKATLIEIASQLEPVRQHTAPCRSGKQSEHDSRIKAALNPLRCIARCIARQPRLPRRRFTQDEQLVEHAHSLRSSGTLFPAFETPGARLRSATSAVRTNSTPDAESNRQGVLYRSRSPHSILG